MKEYDELIPNILTKKIWIESCSIHMVLSFSLSFLNVNGRVFLLSIHITMGWIWLIVFLPAYPHSIFFIYSVYLIHQSVEEFSWIKTFPLLLYLLSYFLSVIVCLLHVTIYIVNHVIECVGSRIERNKK